MYVTFVNYISSSSAVTMFKFIWFATYSVETTVIVILLLIQCVFCFLRRKSCLFNRKGAALELPLPHTLMVYGRSVLTLRTSVE